MAYKVYLKKGEEKRIINGHSWVYANEVARIENKDKNGSLAEVYSNDGRFIGKGYINHASKILVRIFIRNSDIDDEEFYLKCSVDSYPTFEMDILGKTQVSYVWGRDEYGFKRPRLITENEDLIEIATTIYSGCQSLLYCILFLIVSLALHSRTLVN